MIEGLYNRYHVKVYEEAVVGYMWFGFLLENTYNASKNGTQQYCADLLCEWEFILNQHKNELKHIYKVFDNSKKKCQRQAEGKEYERKVLHALVHSLIETQDKVGIRRIKDHVVQIGSQVDYARYVNAVDFSIGDCVKVKSHPWVLYDLKLKKEIVVCAGYLEN